jgi:hypothetical protein
MAGFFFAPQTPEEAEERRKALIANALRRPATNVGEGIGQMMTGLAAAYQRQGDQFPKAPGGAKPGLGALMGNFFTGRNNGGLY